MNVVDALGAWAMGTGPLYLRLADALRDAIGRGELAPGTRLPAERSLARSLAVSRSTVVTAYRALREDGLLESRQGSGTYVRSTPGAALPTLALGSGVESSGFYRGLLEDQGPTIDLSLSCLAGLDDLPDDLVTLAPDDLRGMVPERGYAPLGLPALRAALADQLVQAGVPTTSEQILVTSGAQQAISLIAGLLVQPGETVVVEDPTYPGAMDALAAAGARLVSVPLDSGGARIDALRDVVAGTSPRLVYLMPTFHNPTGAVLSEDRRRDLARMAEELQTPVVEDNTLADIAIDVGPPPILARFAPAAPILSIGSFSKLFWAGLRVGWVRAPSALVTRLGRRKVAMDLGTSVVPQVLAYRLLGDLERMKSFRRVQLAPRIAVLDRLLSEKLPSWRWVRPRGGLSIWIQLPHGDAGEFAQVALRHGVAVTPGVLMSPHRNHSDFIRLSYVVGPDRLESAVERLAEAWAAYDVPATRADQEVAVCV